MIAGMKLNGGRHRGATKNRSRKRFQTDRFVRSIGLLRDRFDARGTLRGVLIYIAQQAGTQNIHLNRVTFLAY